MSEQLMADAEIDREWLDWFGDAWRVYEGFLKQREQLIKRINALKAVDYGKDKVQNGASNHTSEQERYVLKLEKINGLIQNCESILLPAKQRLKQKISRIKRAEYRKILILRYVERWKWTDIIQECFWYEDDFDKSDFSKYKDRVMQWNRAALKQLEDLKEVPYQVVKQLHIEV